MTIENLQKFKALFDEYCRHEIKLDHCNGDTCKWCPIQKAYEEVKAFERRESKVTVRIYNIKWDTDDEKDLIGLPKSVTHTFEGHSELDDELFAEISDWLSDEYWFCVEVFQAEVVKEE